MLTLPISNTSPYSFRISKLPSSSASSIGLGDTMHADEFGIIGDQKVEGEIGKVIDISLKSWASSISRKESSLLLSANTRDSRDGR